MTSGLWWKLWALHRDYEALGQKMSSTKQEIREIESQVKLAGDLQFIERQAKDRLDMVDENELVFVFSDN
jgi:cell division protein FtsB